MAKILLATAFALAVAVAGGAADEGGLTSSAALTRTTYLSTEKAQAIITIVNETAASATLNMAGIGISSDPDGQLSRPYCMVNCWRWQPVQIAPGQRRTVRVHLPSCEVLSDPCVEDVTLRYSIKVGTESYPYVVKLPQYRFIPDPGAVFRDVPNGRPVFIANGYAKATIAPKAIEVSIAAKALVTTAPFSAAAPFSTIPPNAVPSTPPAVFNGIGKMLTNAGVKIKTTTYEPDNPTWYYPPGGGERVAMHIPNSGREKNPTTWRAVFTIDSSPAQLAAVNTALVAVRQSFGDRLSNIFLRPLFDTSYQANPDAYKAALDNAQPQVDRLVELTRSGGLAWTGAAIASSVDADPQSAQEANYDASGVVLYGKISTLTPLTVEIRAQIAYAATRPLNARFAAAIVAQARPAFRSAWAEPTFAPAAEMAVDRPELYVVGSASTKSALAAGIAPEAAALLSARAQTHALAAVLGVRTGHESLIALYSNSMAENQSLGLATTFSGESSLKAARPTTDPNVQVFHSSAVVKPNVPIAIPHPERTLTEMAWVELKQSVDLLRFEIEAVTNGPQLPNEASVAEKIRSVPGVIDAVATASSGQTDVRFEILLRTSSRSLIPRLASLVQTAYAASNPAMSFDLSPFIADCAAVERRALQMALQEDKWAAIGDATTARANLRKLLIVATNPTNEGNTCYPLGREPGPLSDDSLKNIPSAVPAATLSVGAMMIYRTTPLSP